MTFGIIGAGAIGSYYAAQLARAGQRVILHARGEHLARMQERGLELVTPEGTHTTRPEPTGDTSRLGECDVVLVAVKGYDLPDIGPALAAASAKGTLIVPLLNGVDIVDRLVALGVPIEKVAGGLARVSVVRTAPGVVERKTQTDRVITGVLRRNAAHTADTRPRLDALASALTSVGTDGSVSDDIDHELWRKLQFIVAMNVGCGLARTPMGPLLASEKGRALFAGAVAEIGALAAAAGGFLGPQDNERTMGDLLVVNAHVKPSFQLDLERGGPTELDQLAGAVSRLGRVYGVPTPIHDVAVAAFEAALAK
jgi:2-dehydropantoate 2-reductase